MSYRAIVKNTTYIFVCQAQCMQIVCSLTVELIYIGFKFQNHPVQDLVAFASMVPKLEYGTPVWQHPITTTKPTADLKIPKVEAGKLGTLIGVHNCKLNVSQ